MEKQKILIVDDSEMNRSILVDILEDQYDVVEAENGAEAISILSQRREEFSLLLLDIMMPEMDGFAVLDYINQYHWNDTLCRHDDFCRRFPANIKRAYELGAFDYIGRPLIPGKLFCAVSSNTMFLYVAKGAVWKILLQSNFTSRKRTIS